MKPAPASAEGSRLRDLPEIGLPPVIGHRGAAGLAPENTLAALRAAKDAGARWVEFDVRLTADGVPVAIHDATLRRVTGLAAPVARTNFARLSTLDAGGWFADRFQGQRVPALDEVLAACAALRLGANIELKWCGARSLTLARAVAVALRNSPDLPVLASSFHAPLLAAFRRAAPDVPLGLLMRRPRPGWRRIATRLGCMTIHLCHERLEPDLVARIRESGCGVVVYTVNDPGRAVRLLESGVDAVITDRPDLLIRALSPAAGTK